MLDWTYKNQLYKKYFENRGLCIILKNALTHTQPLPIILVKSTMVQSNGTNNIGRDLYTIPLNFNNGWYLSAHNLCYIAVSDESEFRLHS